MSIIGGSSSPKMVFGRRMSTAIDYHVRSKAISTFGTNSFDKRMEEKDQSQRREGRRGLNKSPNRTARLVPPSPVTKSRGAPNALDVDVLRQLKSMHGGEKQRHQRTPTTKKQQNSRKESPSKTSTTLSPSPPKGIARRISQVPHSNEAAVRRWERRPFT